MVSAKRAASAVANLANVQTLCSAADPVFNYLKKASGNESDIGWNFGKFLVGKDGSVIKRRVAPVRHYIHFSDRVANTSFLT